MEKLFESMLWNSRIILVLGVISCMVTGISLIGLGLYEVIHLISALSDYLITQSTTVTRDNIILYVVEILDTFLLASVLFIFAFGLYELFISPIENTRQHASKAYEIKSIDQLKAKLGKVVIMLLVIKVFAYLVEIKPTDILGLLYLAFIVLLVAVSLWLGNGGHNIKVETKKN
ncbi:YqhA family protein [Thalassotalea maritima]|uniref:YqhA family protein n=1 Tax=Thalassotalea maritima TaxID=3242416 RepID=UPI003528CD2A